MNTFFAISLILVALFLILLVLVQRGRGGGLAGALGGMGGQSAFGTKAGDTFTRVTIVAATVWILISLLSVKLLSTPQGVLGDPTKAPIVIPSSASGGTGQGQDSAAPSTSANATSSSAVSGESAGQDGGEPSGTE